MRFIQILAKFAVSLFTREWIEIGFYSKTANRRIVSLFTREWIEIQQLNMFIVELILSPSLRGSGLKSPFDFCQPPDGNVSLFTREWIEILVQFPMRVQRYVSLFTREWIEISTALQIAINPPSLPLYEGVD